MNNTTKFDVKQVRETYYKEITAGNFYSETQAQKGPAQDSANNGKIHTHYFIVGLAPRH
jgi:hypothetical protein